MKRFSLILFFVVCVSVAMATTIPVEPGNNTLHSAINQSQAGDVLVLSDGIYNESNKISIAHPLTICAAEGATPILQMKSRIELSADLDVQGLLSSRMPERELFVSRSVPHRRNRLRPWRELLCSRG